jgi:hypothetical protein
MDRASRSALFRRLQQICGDENVFWRLEDPIVWEYGAGVDRPPTAVAAPANTEEAIQ